MRECSNKKPFYVKEIYNIHEKTVTNDLFEKKCIYEYFSSVRLLFRRLQEESTKKYPVYVQS